MQQKWQDTAKGSFPTNLRYLCSDYASITDVCRRLGINRQQFNKYLSGRSHPTPHSLRRIADFFAVSEEDLAGSLDQLKLTRQRATLVAAGTELSSGSADEQAQLAHYCGRYHTYIRSPIYPGYIFKGFAAFYQHNGRTYSKVLDRHIWADESKPPLTVYKMHGSVCLQGGYLYVHDHRTGRHRSQTLTILYPSFNEEIHLLNGLMVGVASQLDRRPFATNLVYARIPAKVSNRDALKGCGIFKPDAPEIGKDIRVLVENRINPGTDVLVAAPFF